jgi:mannose-6-phosphate isomerase-like protein (cupin superfamily)
VDLEGKTMVLKTINFAEKLDKFTDHWSPKIIAEMNDYQFKLVKIQGEFVWHKHHETDEVFIVLDGEMSIAFRDGTVHLSQGEMVVVPKGMEHMPVAHNECKLMVIEPAGTVNTGDTRGEMTKATPDWI